MSICTLCDLNEPNEWCWEDRIDCPFEKPPRHMDARLWREIVGLHKRLKALEEGISLD